MKQTLHRPVILGLVGLALVVTAGLGVYFQTLAPEQIIPTLNGKKTPVITYHGTNNSDRPTMTQADKQQADSTGPKTPTAQVSAPATATPQPAPTTNSPKQAAIRASTKHEYTYYPATATPNDPGYASEWSLQHVNAPAAWTTSTGNGKTVVAVIDTGFALTHEDLASAWYTNPGETGVTKAGDRCWTGAPQDKATNNCDDDNDGYVDDWRGWNFNLGTNNPQAGQTNPNGAAVAHGTETAGLAGSIGNNGTGVTTIDWNTKIMPLQVLSDDGPGYTSDVVAAIYYAVDHGASVISMSLGGSSFDSTLQDAISYAYTHNVPVVAAAGNCGTGTESGCTTQPAGVMSYPALFDHVISVGATDINDQRASFSSYGPRLDIMAPGSGSIVSPTWTPNNGTSLYSGTLYGTSFSTPQVASLVALVKSIRPNSSVDDVRALLMATATKTGAMNTASYSEQYGHGIMNAGKALQVASSLNATTTSPSLLQAGGATSEHSYNPSDTFGSGCTAQAGSYCTIRIRNATTGAERYLPYAQASTSSLGWNWPATLLTATGSWDIQAEQGDRFSNPYTIMNK